MFILLFTRTTWNLIKVASFVDCLKRNYTRLKEIVKKMYKKNDSVNDNGISLIVDVILFSCCLTIFQRPSQWKDLNLYLDMIWY